MAKRQHDRGYNSVLEVENYRYTINTFFLSSGTKTVNDVATALQKEKMNRTFERLSK